MASLRISKRDVFDLNIDYQTSIVCFLHCCITTIGTLWFFGILARLNLVCLLQCGNGKVDVGEECDGNELGDHTCKTLHNDLP